MLSGYPATLHRHQPIFHNTATPHHHNDTAMPLTTLPNELLFETASYLSTSSLNHLLQTNQLFNSVLTPALVARALGISSDVLSWAAEHNSLPVTKFLLANTASITTASEISGPRGHSPLQLAAVNGCVSIVKAFIAHCPDIIASAHAENGQPTSSQTPMILAARNGHVNVVRAFIDTYLPLSPAQCPIDVYNPLKMALAKHHDLVVRFLLRHLDPKYWSRILPHAAGAGWSVLIVELLPLLTEYHELAVANALRQAAGNGHMRCVEELVERVNQAELQRALQAAARGRWDDVVVYLLEWIDDKVTASTGALYSAVRGGSRDVLNLLLANGCDVHATLEFPGWKRKATILHWIACNAGRIARLDRMCAILLEAGARAYAHHKYFKSPRRMIMKYPPSATSGRWGAYSSVQKAFMNGETYQIVKKSMYGVYSEEKIVWHEHDYVKNLAEEVEVEFVEAAEWF